MSHVFEVGRVGSRIPTITAFVSIVTAEIFWSLDQKPR